jgi:hypothetical protein
VFRNKLIEAFLLLFWGVEFGDITNFICPKREITLKLFGWTLGENKKE